MHCGWPGLLSTQGDRKDLLFHLVVPPVLCGAVWTKPCVLLVGSVLWSAVLYSIIRQAELEVASEGGDKEV